MSNFPADGYHIIKSAVSKDLLDIYYLYSRYYLRIGCYFEFDSKSASMGRYADGVGEALLSHLEDRISDELGQQVLPSYSFLRFYTPESRLIKHVDRPACEITGTMTIGPKDITPWPIHLQLEDRVVSAELEPGDLLLFRGPTIPHWRDPLPDGHCLQVFLHYVFKDGDYEEYKFDQREKIGPQPVRHPVTA